MLSSSLTGKQVWQQDASNNNNITQGTGSIVSQQSLKAFTKGREEWIKIFVIPSSQAPNKVRAWLQGEKNIKN